MNAYVLVNSEYERTDIERGVLFCRDPVLIYLYELLDSLNDEISVKLGYAKTLAGNVHSRHVLFRAEELDLAVCASVSLHALEALLSVMKHHRSGIELEGSVRNYSCVMPALTLVIVHNEHVIGVVVAEAELCLIGFLLGICGFGYFDLHNIAFL